MACDGMWHRVPRDEYPIQKVMPWAEMVSKSMKKEHFHGIVMGKCLRTFKPPANTIGTLLSWIRGGRNYSIMEHKNANHLQIKKYSAIAREDLCVLYFYCYQIPAAEPEQQDRLPAPHQPLPASVKMDSEETNNMDVDENNRKREGPETRTIVMAPENKKAADYFHQEGAGVLADVLHGGVPPQDHPGGLPFRMEDRLRPHDLYHQKLLATRQRLRTRIIACALQNRVQDGLSSYGMLAVCRVDEETRNIEDDEISAELWDQLTEQKWHNLSMRKQITAEMTVVVDARWIRKWKRCPDRSLRVKSRLCARGFLDRQRGELTTRSTTATRLSQRLLVSHAASQRDRSLETIDTRKGFSFEQIRDALRKAGVSAPKRIVVVLPPLKVYRNLGEMDESLKVPPQTT